MSKPATPSSHGQPTPDPISHFKAIPWCNQILSEKSTIHIAVPDRRPKLENEYTLVKEALNTPSTVKACITAFRMPKKGPLRPGEEKKNPFIEISAFLDLGSGLNGYAGTAHGGFLATVFDEVMGTAAWQQSGDNGAYTVEMNVKYKKPIFTPTVVRCVGSVVKKEGRRIVVEAAFVGEDMTVFAEAQAVFLEMKRNIGKAKEEKYGTAKANL